VIGPPLAGEALERMKAAVATGKPGKAMAIFVRDVVRVPPSVARLVRPAVAASPRLHALAPRQLDDLEAIDRLGVRLDEYARIAVPIVLVGGDRSPAHLGERLDALERTLPHVERVVLHGQGHDAHVTVHRAPVSLSDGHCRRSLPYSNSSIVVSIPSNQESHSSTGSHSSSFPNTEPASPMSSKWVAQISFFTYMRKRQRPPPLIP
jgi:hypothetical protein